MVPIRKSILIVTCCFFSLSDQDVPFKVMPFEVIPHFHLFVLNHVHLRSTTDFPEKIRPKIKKTHFRQMSHVIYFFCKIAKLKLFPLCVIDIYFIRDIK